MSENNESGVTILNPSLMDKSGVRGEIVSATYSKREEVERKNKDGRPFTSKSHHFINDDGTLVILNTTGLLDYLINKKEVESGDRVKINYFGKDAKGFHKFDLIK